MALFYGQYGEWVTDTGSGTYDLSDFHHNGDLSDYFDPWEINFGIWVLVNLQRFCMILYFLRVKLFFSHCKADHIQLTKWGQSER